jgi:hypothetical protein
MGTSPITLGVGNGAQTPKKLSTTAQRPPPPAQNQLPGAHQAEFVICDQAIELAFKRLKGLLGLDRLPAKSDSLARSWLLSHLILALLIDDASQDLLDSPPCAGREAPAPRLAVAHRARAA